MSSFQTGERSQSLVWLEEAERRLTDLVEAEAWRREVTSLRLRLSADERWVAVFGAFSAGKSSLINALLGEPLLEVSPHPTTAAVTRVLGVRDGESAGALVRTKQVKAMAEDVFQALARLRRPTGPLADVLALAGTLRPVDFPSYLRPQVSFLQSAAAGWLTMSTRLGQTWSVTGEELAQMTVNENLACYVDQVDIRTSNAWLADGLNLVDTPGVDSIHRRHTELAFEHVHRADAVIFVLYFTHAFSRADKDFLNQLADIQNIAGTDKLFVVLNAVDLAVSAEERQTVRDRVQKELDDLGLGQSRVYEVSSQLALAAAQMQLRPENRHFMDLIRLRLGLSSAQPLPAVADLAQQSGVPQLREELTAWLRTQRHTLHEQTTRRLLTELAAESVTWVQHLQIQALASVAEQEEQARVRRLLAETADTARQHLVAGKSQVEHTLRENWEELVFHAGERLRMNLPGLFRESFQPGRFLHSITARQDLQEAANELAATLSRQVDREVRTFALRVDKATAEELTQLRQQWVGRLGEVHALLHQNPSLAVGVQEVGAVMSHPNMGDSAARDLTRETFVDEMDVTRLAVSGQADLPTGPILAHVRLFRNAQTFFEGGGQQAMQQAVEQDMLPVLLTELGRRCDQVVEYTLARLRRQAADLLEGMTAALMDGAGEPFLGTLGDRNGIQERLLRWQAMSRWLQEVLSRSREGF